MLLLCSPMTTKMLKVFLGKCGSLAPFTDAMNIDPLGRELEACVEEAVVHMKIL